MKCIVKNLTFFLGLRGDEVLEGELVISASFVRFGLSLPASIASVNKLSKVLFGLVGVNVDPEIVLNFCLADALLKENVSMFSLSIPDVCLRSFFLKKKKRSGSMNIYKRPT